MSTVGQIEKTTQQRVGLAATGTGLMGTTTA